MHVEEGDWEQTGTAENYKRYVSLPTKARQLNSSLQSIFGIGGTPKVDL